MAKTVVRIRGFRAGTTRVEPEETVARQRSYFRRLESGYTSANVGQRCAAVHGRNSPHKLSSAGDRGRLEALPVGLRTPRVGLVWCAACVRAPAANK